MTDTEREILEEQPEEQIKDMLFDVPEEVSEYEPEEEEAPKKAPKKASRKKEKKPREKKKAGFGTWLYRIVLLVLLGVMIFSGVKVATIYSGYQAGTKVYDKVAESALTADETSDRLKIDWSALLAQNSDVVAWIRCPGTVINYPVVQGSDNEYYLEFLINGEWNAKGTPFVDTYCPSPFNDYMTIIYGHRMKDGSMFASLLNYFDDASYFSKYPTIELYTPAGDYDLEIVSGAKIDAADGTYYRFGEFSAEDRLAYGSRITDANIILGFDKDIALDGTERLVMLSTCTPQSDHNRFVIWGRLVPAD